ncbi:PREDICTED: insulin-like growth factor-binding protein 3, partial [Dipodomys ordii]|uniref:Insulin-like growth factor-binding protein 3 n=1 Tax=Dipodomys ordii TaxID=10020 RepID=A0A1S3GWR0_DIPOR
MHRARPALWAALLTALALLRGPPVARAGAGAVGAGPVVRCEPCDANALAQCAPPPAAPACAELVREPGCGCCLTCALREGQPCGVYTERCSSGHSCQEPPGEPRPLQALLDGRGFCVNASATGRLHAYLLPAPSAPSEPRATAGNRSGAAPETANGPDLEGNSRRTDKVIHVE